MTKKEKTLLLYGGLGAAAFLLLGGSASVSIGQPAAPGGHASPFPMSTDGNTTVPAAEATTPPGGRFRV